MLSATGLGLVVQNACAHVFHDQSPWRHLLPRCHYDRPSNLIMSVLSARRKSSKSTSPKYTPTTDLTVPPQNKAPPQHNTQSDTQDGHLTVLSSHLPTGETPLYAARGP